MLTSAKCNVLLPERILKEKSNWTKSNFDFAVRNYLLRYPNYRLLYVEGPFAVCERDDVERERRKES
jgi:hypothetical protein